MIFVQFTLFLMIGVLLWVYENGRTFGKDELDRLYPSFIWNSLPVGIAGLAMAAIIAAAMANLSAALNSLASATVVDFYQPLTASRHTARALSTGIARLYDLLGRRAGGDRDGGQPLGLGA